eukprot:maker-scaffold_1-snap-gene-9.15-mRNA-1 protein AED:0.12 eAED:0.12 QI:0/1/0.5/1/1/1/2/399/439
MISQIVEILYSNRIVQSEGHADVAKPYGLVLAPTRELATQIFQECLRFSYKTGVQCVVVYGGAKIQYQINHLLKHRYGCNILVATPGRLMDLAERGVISFANVRFLVLDEADRLLDLGFEPQITRIVSDFDMPSKEGIRQTAMFSATFAEPIQQLASSFMENYVFITVGRVGATTKSITQNILYVQDTEKLQTLLQHLQRSPARSRILVFMETKKSCDSLSMYLNRAFGQVSVPIHGDKTQFQRERALRDFKDTRNSIRILIATDVAARGLDIPNVAQVINYDLPNDIDSYVHRIGRTGRAGNKGTATSYINEKHGRMAKDLIRVLQEASQVVPDFLYSLKGSRQSSAKYTRSTVSSQPYYGGTDFRRWAPQPQTQQYNFYPMGNSQPTYGQNYYFSGQTVQQNYPSLPQTIPENKYGNIQATPFNQQVQPGNTQTGMW